MDKIKKKMFLLMAAILVFAALASEGSMASAAGTQLRSSTGAGSSGKNVLVAYFSRAGENYGVGNVKKGNTKIVAQMIARQTGGKLFQIETKKAYPKTYEECIKVAEQEAEDNARPALKKKVKNMDQYDTVYLGYPIWYGDMPMAVYTFLESYDWDGKTVIPFCTHEGSGLSGTPASIRKIVGNKAAVETGLSVTGSTAQNSRAKTKKKVSAWIKKIEKKASSMTVSIKGTGYSVELDQNETVDALVGKLPLNMTLKRYAGHEYYSELPADPPVASGRTSEIKAGHIYYWDGWNAFVINYKDTDISPYKVVHIGEIKDKNAVGVLEDSGSNLKVKVSAK